MKKTVVFIALILAAFCVFANGATEKLSGTAGTIEEAKGYSVEKLIELAKAETGNFTVYSTSSKTDKNVKAFAEKYGLTGEFSAVKQSESAYYEAIEKLIDGGSTDIDALVTQNGASLGVELDAGNAINFIPSTVPAADTYAFMYYVKEFAISKASAEAFTNVWDLTDTAVEVQFKKSGEPINQLFMAELTTEAWAAKLATAYDAKFGAGKCDEALKSGNYKNAGYMFLDKFLSRVVNVSSEGDCAKNCANAETPFVGFSPVSKYSLGETGNFNKVNFLEGMNGFKGYAYKFYYEISKTTDRPYTAMLYAYYLSDSNGIATWTSEGNGIYSATDPDIANLLNNCVIENFGDVRSSWANIVKLLETYV